MSRSLQSFNGKVRSLKIHVQLADVAFTRINRYCSRRKGNGKTVGETLGTTNAKHPQLNEPNESIEISRIFATSRIKINEQAIIELYAFFADYLSSVIREMEGVNPNRILGIVPPDSPTNLSFKDVFTLGSYPAILDEIARRVFRSLENERSTPNLLKKFIKATKLNVPVNLRGDALVYLEIRHLIIHNNSKADDKFNSLNNRGLVSVNVSNKKVIINYKLSNAAIDAVTALCQSIDSELVRLGFI